MIRHCCIRIGRWKFENWHLYLERQHRAAKDPKIRWLMWDRIL